MSVADMRQRRNMLLLQMLSEIFLIIATLPLWTNTSDFPAIPLFAVFVDVPSLIDRLLTVSLLLCCAVTIAVVARDFEEANSCAADKLWRRLRLWLGIATLLGSLLVVLNQHRLQPWHWLFLLLNVQCLTLRFDDQKFSRRLTLASIYIFAAVSRFGPDIDARMSSEVLATLLNMAGLSTVARNEAIMFTGCVGMTLSELLAGILLLVPRFRRAGVALTMTAHVTLLVALGPWGLDHNHAVLIWNVFFLLAIPVAFLDPRGSASILDSTAEVMHGTKSRFAACMNFGVIAFPLAGLLGFADNWPSWQLYSPRPDVIRLYVSERIATQLPERLRSHIGQPLPLQTWCSVRLDRWSLEETGSPIYPEDRFQLGLAAALLPDDAAENDVRIIVDTADNFAWWRRSSMQITSLADLREHCESFYLNTRVRPE